MFLAAASGELRHLWRAADHEVVAPSDLVTHEITDGAKRASEAILQEVWRVPVGGSSLAERFAYRGIPLTDVAHAHLVGALFEALVKVAALDEWLKRRGAERIWLPRETGEWSSAAQALAVARQMPVRRLQSIPHRAALWPPTRRSVTQWLPGWVRRWRERREAESAEAEFLGEWRRRAAEAANSVEVLGIAHYVGEGRTLAPVVSKMREEGRHTVALRVDSWGRAGEIFDKADLPYSLLQALGPWDESAARIRKALPALGKLWRTALASDQARAIRHRGVPITALVRTRWCTLGDISLRHDCLRQYLWWVELIERALAAFSPRLVLLADEVMPFGVIAVNAAERMGIRTLNIIHGAMLDHPKHRACWATRVVVGGEASRRFLRSRGTADERIVVTGLPQFDPLADDQALSRVPVRRQLGIPDGVPLVVYTMLSGAGVTPLEEVLAATREVLDAAEHLRGACSFVFKRHPADRADILSKTGVDLAARGIVATIDAPLHPLLWNADLVITQMSTTGQEAIMLGKPLIVVDVAGKPDTIPYVEYGAALGVYETGALAGAIHRALHDEAVRRSLAAGRERFIADFAYRNDGKATDRILDEVDRLVTPGA